MLAKSSRKVANGQDFKQIDVFGKLEEISNCSYFNGETICKYCSYFWKV